MDGALFQYALLPCSISDDPADWIVNDADPHYICCDVVDFPEGLISQVYALYVNSYRKLSKKKKTLLISDANGLLKYNRWLLFYGDDDYEKTVVCFCLYRTTDYGLKSALTGSNGTSDGKRTVLTFKTKSFNVHDVFGEISGALEDRIISDVPIVKFKFAKEILEHFGKSDVVKRDNNHYTRKIGSLGDIDKIMVGLPRYQTTNT